MGLNPRQQRTVAAADGSTSKMLKPSSKQVTPKKSRKSSETTTKKVRLVLTVKVCDGVIMEYVIGLISCHAGRL